MHLTAAHGSQSESGSHQCDDTCFYHEDGNCDDGGRGAEFHECALGSDCTDCGDGLRHRRFMSPSSPPPWPALPPYRCILDATFNLRELPNPKSCPALDQAECRYWRVNNHVCEWIAQEATVS